MANVVDQAISVWFVPENTRMHGLQLMEANRGKKKKNIRPLAGLAEETRVGMMPVKI